LKKYLILGTLISNSFSFGDLIQSHHIKCHLYADHSLAKNSCPSSKLICSTAYNISILVCNRNLKFSEHLFPYKPIPSIVFSTLIYGNSILPVILAKSISYLWFFV
jgi:hypothetical protein